eukprot:CAMPEP_0176115878 /NCGR_PEP_ID=MMETSP0120_2-20121206/58194_1 /TAXON_ID=160619 /ORGANISM="Kryptoperidinium foliaceum, Strain CCMP 1326" /LENGTH=528 /DNA_ID=CAMNT_0017450121 /DNA_START=71 /DNA_END=1654 /DNA_ORIENTATION=-
MEPGGVSRRKLPTLLEGYEPAMPAPRKHSQDVIPGDAWRQVRAVADTSPRAGLAEPPPGDRHEDDCINVDAPEEEHMSPGASGSLSSRRGEVREMRALAVGLARAAATAADASSPLAVAGSPSSAAASATASLTASAVRSPAAASAAATSPTAASLVGASPWGTSLAASPATASSPAASASASPRRPGILQEAVAAAAAAASPRVAPVTPRGEPRNSAGFIEGGQAAAAEASPSTAAALPAPRGPRWPPLETAAAMAKTPPARVAARGHRSRATSLLSGSRHRRSRTPLDEATQALAADDVVGRFDGRWLHMDGPEDMYVETIVGERMHWYDGTDSKIRREGDRGFSVKLTGNSFRARLKGGVLVWDDGDIWVREGSLLTADEADAKQPVDLAELRKRLSSKMCALHGRSGGARCTAKFSALSRSSAASSCMDSSSPSVHRVASTQPPSAEGGEEGGECAGSPSHERSQFTSRLPFSVGQAPRGAAPGSAASTERSPTVAERISRGAPPSAGRPLMRQTSSLPSGGAP